MRKSKGQYSGFLGLIYSPLRSFFVFLKHALQSLLMEVPLMLSVVKFELRTRKYFPKEDLMAPASIQRSGTFFGSERMCRMIVTLAHNQ